MKKSIKIATLGVAAFGFAAAPAAGVFAASTGGPFTDTIDVTINNSCTFARGTAFSKKADGSIDAATGAGHVAGDSSIGSWAEDLLSASIDAGSLHSNYGSSNFVVACNNEDGWKVTAAATALTGKTTTTENIPLGTPAADTAAWNYTSSSSDTAITGTGTYAAAEQVVAQSATTTPTAGRTFAVKYAVSVDHALSAQTYEGTITYTFAQLDAA